MSKRNLKQYSKTNWKRVDAMKDEGIDYSDSPELEDEFFKTASIIMPQTKVAITIRVDKDVIEWFKSGGPKYQTRINALLRGYMKTKTKKAS